MPQSKATPDDRSLQFQVEQVLEARRVKAETLKRYGGRSAVYLDARDLVRMTEGKLLDMTIRMFAPPAAEAEGECDD